MHLDKQKGRDRLATLQGRKPAGHRLWRCSTAKMLCKARDCAVQMVQQTPKAWLLSLSRLAVSAVSMPWLSWACCAHLAVMEVQNKVLKTPAVTMAATWHAALQSMSQNTPAICACGARCLQHVAVAAVHVQLEPILLHHTALLLLGDISSLLHPMLLWLCPIAVANRMNLPLLLQLLQLCSTVTEL